LKDYIEPPIKSKVKIRGYNGSTNSTRVGTVKWKIKDDNGKVHNFILPNIFYSSSVETRLLSPQHLAQVRNKGRDTYCLTYHDAVIMRWNKDKYQITAPLDNRKHSNVGVIRSAPGIKNYLTSCEAYDHEHATLAYPATINIDEEAGINQQAPNDQMREPTSHEIEPLLHDEDTSVEDEYPTYSQDSQEYMHWHYRLNHPSHTVISKMGEQGRLPRRITKILATMQTQHKKPPMCHDCCGAKAHLKYIAKYLKTMQVQ